MLTPQFTEIQEILAQLYPEVHSELNFKNDYELVVSVALSAQCTDKKVNEITPILFARFPDFEKLAEADINAIEGIIRPINYYKTKSKNIKALAQFVTEKYAGKLPKTHQQLTELPGVGRKTANVVICEYGITPALPVDTHVLRLSNRLGFSEQKTPEGVERDLMKIFPPESWRELHHRLIFHGRRVCKAQTPLCGECRLNQVCPSAR